jgi:hypothetical protein
MNKRIETKERKEALEWWNKLSLEQQRYQIELNTKDKPLTNRDIELIYETNQRSHNNTLI